MVLGSMLFEEGMVEGIGKEAEQGKSGREASGREGARSGEGDAGSSPETTQEGDEFSMSVTSFPGRRLCGRLSRCSTKVT